MHLVRIGWEYLSLHLMACLDKAATSLIGPKRLALVAITHGGSKGLFVPHVCRGNRHVTNHVDLLLFGTRRRIHLDRVELVLTHDCFPDIDSVHITPIANIPEAEIQVIALKADPVANSLHFR